MRHSHIWQRGCSDRFMRVNLIFPSSGRVSSSFDLNSLFGSDLILIRAHGKQKKLLSSSKQTRSGISIVVLPDFDLNGSSINSQIIWIYS